METGSRLVLPGAGVKGKWGMTANRYGASFCGDDPFGD